MKDRDNSEQSGGEDEDCFVKGSFSTTSASISDKKAAEMLLSLSNKSQ